MGVLAHAMPGSVPRALGIIMPNMLALRAPALHAAYCTLRPRPVLLHVLCI